MGEHPQIARALETGYPWLPRTRCPKCRECGEGIGEDEAYYEVYGAVFCERCMKDFKKYG